MSWTNSPEGVTAGARGTSLPPEATRASRYPRLTNVWWALRGSNPRLSVDVLALDRVQKGLPIDAQVARKLRQRGLVEGRRPKLHISASVAKASATKADYIRTRAQDDAHYQKLVTDYLREFGAASRRDIDALLWDKLSDALSDEQRANKIGNLLTKWRRNGVIYNAGSRPSPEWKLQVADAE